MTGPNNEQRAERLFREWNAQPTRAAADQYVTLDDFRDALDDCPECDDAQITEIVDDRAAADLNAT